ncbi:MAG: class I SAM-dependent rRNA methyltransferase [Melioribacteraceae bacterium]|nr:class I SAM-dependent rRNA methyltransferase [Melioribacteraceae bacterium]
MAKIILKKNEDRRVIKGHQWIFSNEIHLIEESPENGSIVEVYDSKNKFLGSGFYNKNSLISVRILSREKIENTAELLKERILAAYELRKTCLSGRESYRLVFSESDFMPGLIIDRYNDTYVLQVYSYGMEKNIELVCDILKNELGAKNIFSKNEEYYRVLEGLPIEDKVYLGEIADEVISEGEIKYTIDFTKGHKTGFYFDQSDNRQFLSKLVLGKTMLDCFCNSGGFGLNALKANAKSVTFVDSSETEMENAKRNIFLNELSGENEFVVGDVFEKLEKYKADGRIFDIVNLDPPAFAKNKKNLLSAIAGYEKLNKLGMEVLANGGLLSTSSCSFHLKKKEFLESVQNAARKAKKEIKLVYYNTASMDHPVLPEMNETSYLKFALFFVKDL